jgi:hypothetical protein
MNFPALLPWHDRGLQEVLKEAEKHVGSKYVDQVLDSLYIEISMRLFFMPPKLENTSVQAGKRSTISIGKQPD